MRLETQTKIKPTYDLKIFPSEAEVNPKVWTKN